MADNVAITAGTGTAIAADDVSSVFYQKIKLDVGGDSDKCGSAECDTMAKRDTHSDDITEQHKYTNANKHGRDCTDCNISADSYTYPIHNCRG